MHIQTLIDTHHAICTHTHLHTLSPCPLPLWCVVSHRVSAIVGAHRSVHGGTGCGDILGERWVCARCVIFVCFHAFLLVYLVYSAVCFLLFHLFPLRCMCGVVHSCVSGVDLPGDHLGLHPSLQAGPLTATVKGRENIISGTQHACNTHMQHWGEGRVRDDLPGDHLTLHV